MKLHICIHQRGNHADGRCFIRFSKFQFLKTAVESLIRFNHLTVFIRSSGSYNSDVTFCKFRSQYTRRTAISLPRINQSMQFVYKENGFINIMQIPDNVLQSVLNLTFITCSGNKHTHIQFEYRSILKK